MSDRPDDFVEWAHVEDIASIPLTVMGAGGHAIKIARLALATRAEVQELRVKLAAIDAVLAMTQADPMRKLVEVARILHPEGGTDE